jgi:hypothetical protein
MADALIAAFICLFSQTLNTSHIMRREHTLRRFTRTSPCPICGGHDNLNRGQGVRCFGYYDGSGTYARCTREDRAGSLPPNRDGTYSHRLHGPCRCGETHGKAPASEGRASPDDSTLRRRAEQRFRSFFTLTAFLRRRYGDGTAIRFWIYRDAAGNEVFRVLRVDYKAPDDSAAKSYRPCHKADDGKWLLSRPPVSLPLYNLPDILSAPPQAIVTVLEGEKCTDIAAAIGLPYVTTSAHGAKAPWLTDWSPLAGRHVAIIADAGESGEEYAAKVAGLLAALDTPARVRVVSLPGLADGDDIEQFIDARRSAGGTDSEILSELHTLIAPPC